MKSALVALALVVCLQLGGEWSGAAEPALTIETEGENVSIGWPQDSAALGYVLESAGSPTNKFWEVVPGVVTNSILVSPSGAARYFRLINSTNGVILSGVVQSGVTSATNPIAGVTVKLCEAGTNQPAILGEATTDASGRFALLSSKASTDGAFFVTATLSADVELIAILGPQTPAEVVVNELTTVAATCSMAQFYRGGAISGDPFALRIAAGMNDNLVDISTGGSSSVMLTSPNADESISLRMTRSLANVLAACITDPTVAIAFRQLAADPLLPAPITTSQAMANLARNPGLNVSSIYALATIRTPYRPALFNAPVAWTVTVKVNDSGDDNHLIGGLGNIVFGDNGFAWITDNVVQGTPYSTRLLVVLQPNGKPADGSNGTPLSPISTGGLLGSGYGITIDPVGSVWVGNFGWGPDHSCEYYPSTATNCNGSVSQFTPSGEPVSGPLGYQGGPLRAQGMASDADGNIWICSYGDNSIYVFFNGSPTNVASLQEYLGSQPFDVQIGGDGTAWITCGGGIAGEYPSSLIRVEIVDDQLQRLWQTFFGNALKGLSLDSKGNAWVTSQGDNKVYVVNTNGAVIGSFDGGGVNGPWGATVDGDDNVWVANFGPLSPAPYSSRLSKLAGANPVTRPPGLNLGDPISPVTGYTLPSAGSEVLLHDGTPLYGPDGPEAYDPLQRLTATAIDRAGNLWALNNWKNKFANDITSNPGGDGVVIFVGLAAPPKK